MTSKLILSALATVGALAVAGSVHAKEYVDYGYAKGLWEINQIEVDPNHVDDYLTGLKQSEVPGFDIMKKHGIIDDYYIAVKQGYTEGKPNVVIGVHFVGAAGLMPDAARDEMLDKEIYATFSEAAGKTAVAGYEKYRKFLDNSAWLDVDFKK